MVLLLVVAMMLFVLPLLYRIVTSYTDGRLCFGIAQETGSHSGQERSALVQSLMAASWPSVVR